MGGPGTMNATLVKGPNCRACDEFLQILQEAAKKHTFVIQVTNAEDEPELVKKFNIRSVPTTIIHCKGSIYTIVGKISPERLEKMFKNWGCT